MQHFGRFVCVAALAAAVGCGARERAGAKPDKSQQEERKPDDKPAEKPAPPAPDMSGAMAAAGLMGALSQAGQPGPFDEPTHSNTYDRSEPHVAVVELGGAVTELEDMSLFSFGSGGVPLHDVAERLRALAGDEHVTAILLRVSELELSMAQAEELRATIKAVRAKKPVDCYTEAASNATYVVLTGCDKIGLAPTGDLAIAGPAMAPMYMKGLLAKLGVEADFIHIGAFKGAAEPLTRDGPSPEMRQTYDDILTGAYTRLVDAIADGRKLDRDKAVAAVDQGLFTEEQAKAAGLVDDVAVWETWRDQVSGGKPWVRVAIKKEAAKDMAGLMELLGLTPRPRVTKPHIALVYAVGEVVDGKGGSGSLSPFSEIASRRLSAALRAIAADDSVKAVVLRVDSPGGSALASEIIWHAVDEVKKSGKPVIVSMGSVAASGGYYISSGADAIWAQPDTITGSIGVIGGKLVLGPALGKLGITVVELGKGKHAGLMSGMKKWSADERATIEAQMRHVYDAFKGRVAAGRGRKPEDIEPIAQGRVWIGQAAKDKGLVDQLGGLDDALADARKRGKLPDDAPVDVYPQEPTLIELLEGLGGDVSVGWLGGAALQAELAQLVGPSGARTVLATLKLLAGFQSEHVRAVVFLPLVVR
jgi:protease-4